MDILGVAEIGRLAATEGAVLLKNDRKALPVRDEVISVFGRTQINYYKSGTGSGGAVNVSRSLTILEAFRENPHIRLNETLASAYEDLVKLHPADYNNTFEADFSDKEIELSDELVQKAGKQSDKAVVIIGRVAGEGYDNKNEPGSFLLTPKEHRLLEQVCHTFSSVSVLINAGNIINMSWLQVYPIDAVMYVWQGGQFGAKAIADLISGDQTPSGKLCDTIAHDYKDYPSSQDFGNEWETIYREDIYVGYRYFETFQKEKVLFPFGYGLSYTRFEVNIVEVSFHEQENKGIQIKVEVTNIGDKQGKEIVQVYGEAPGGCLGKPSRSLMGFSKTKALRPGEKTGMQITIDIDELSSYDDEGQTGFESSYVLEPGNYNIYCGTDVRDAKKIYTYHQQSLEVIRTLTKKCLPLHPFNRLVNRQGKMVYEPVTALNNEVNAYQEVDVTDRILPMTGDRGHKLNDVATGAVDMSTFIAQMSEDELMAICRGEGMLSPKVTPGTASCFGGVTASLESLGIPPCSTADGPSGIRMDCNEKASSLPCGTLLACMWNPELTQGVYEMVSLELAANQIDILLGPGMNIHRNPLCGRNFEYFSEDPYITGITASAMVRGIQKGGSGAAIKHFALNNQEYCRNQVSATVSERALREIYLKGFEMVVRNAKPLAIMTSYNPINGYYAASNSDLNTGILSEEWGYEGLVMTDWWATMNDTPKGEVSKRNRRAMVQSGNHIYMVVDNDTAADHSLDNLKESLEGGQLSIGTLQQNAARICKVMTKLPALKGQYASVGLECIKLPVLSRITVNGERIQFNPYQWDMEFEHKDQVMVEANYPFYVKDYEGMKEIVVETYGEVNPAVHGKSVYKFFFGRAQDVLDKEERQQLEKQFITNNTSIMCALNGTPGATFEIPLDIKYAHRYRISLYGASEASSLAQLSVQMTINGQKEYWSIQGSDGRMLRSDYIYIELEEGEQTMTLDFGKHNFGAFDLRFIQLEFADNIG